MGYRILQYRDILTGIPKSMKSISKKQEMRNGSKQDEQNPPIPENHELNEIIEKYQLGLNSIYRELSHRIKEQASESNVMESRIFLLPSNLLNHYREQMHNFLSHAQEMLSS